MGATLGVKSVSYRKEHVVVASLLDAVPDGLELVGEVGATGCGSIEIALYHHRKATEQASNALCV